MNPIQEAPQDVADDIDVDAIRLFLDRLGNAISEGDAARAAECWDIPALVLSDEGAIPVSNRVEVERFFTQAVEWYHSKGIVATRPVIERARRLSRTLASVDVRWPGFDASGTERWSERSHYILTVAADGQPRIRVGLTLGDESGGSQ